MKKSLLLLGLLLALIVWFVTNEKKPKLARSKVNAVAVTNGSSNAEVVDFFDSTTATDNKNRTVPTDDMPDVLSATNLEQWKSLIKDLRQDAALPNQWATTRLRATPFPVVLKHNGQSIVYEAECIDVTTIPRTTNVLKADIYSPQMNIGETRDLGLKLCSMFNLDSSRFSAWCDTVGTNWLDMPLFSAGGDNHYRSFRIRRSYGNEKPWFIIFTVQQESAVAELLRRPIQ